MKRNRPLKLFFLRARSTFNVPRKLISKVFRGSLIESITEEIAAKCTTASGLILPINFSRSCKLLIFNSLPVDITSYESINAFLRCLPTKPFPPIIIFFSFKCFLNSFNKLP